MVDMRCRAAYALSLGETLHICIDASYYISSKGEGVLKLQVSHFSAS